MTWECFRCSGSRAIMMATGKAIPGQSTLVKVRCPACCGTVSLKRKLDMDAGNYARPNGGIARNSKAGLPVYSSDMTGEVKRNRCHD